MSKAKLRAEAIDRFVTDARAQGVYDSLKAACILTGWDTLAGALTPLVGSAPTNSGFVAGDYDRGGQGLKGNGSSKYLNSNRANNADNYLNHHMATYCSDARSAVTNHYRIGATSTACTLYHTVSGANFYGRDGHSIYAKNGSDKSAGFVGSSRSDNSGTNFRIDGETWFQAGANPFTGDAYPFGVFCRNATGTFQEFGAFTLSWYSIGSSVDLAALDTLVTRLMADLRAIEEDGMDRDSLRYIRAVEAADGSFMTTGVYI